MPLTLDLTGNVVLLTGATGGIGSSIAREMTSAGARVALHYSRNAEVAKALEQELAGNARSFQADLSHCRACIDLWDEVVAQMGCVDVLVNNAGVALSAPLDIQGPIWIEAWDATLATNLTAAAILSRAAVLHFVARGGGRIVNIASRAAFRGDQPEYLAYAASKGGLVSLTRSIARGFGKSGVKAFVIAPGFTRTEMAKEFFDRYGEDFGTADIALNRLTTPEDIAPTVVFLASGLADHATGCTIDINAGSYVH